MELTRRIQSFHHIHTILSTFSMDNYDNNSIILRKAMETTFAANPWFTIENQVNAIKAIGQLLEKEKLSGWIEPYSEEFSKDLSDKTVAVVMAGNIPLVGFHDFLCVLLSGFKICARLSGDDSWLLPAITDMMSQENPHWNNMITFSHGKLSHFDAIIATGSDNSKRYFDYYFGKYPHIIRHHRNSVAVLNGQESQEELEGIAEDIMSYFGLGCRNISKIYVPSGYDFTVFINILSSYQKYSDHHKYRNNYDYNKSLFLINQIPFLDTGSLLITKNREISSRIAVLHFEEYDDIQFVKNEITSFYESIQCIVSALPIGFECVLPGQTQNPGLNDYPDRVNILDFLLKI